MCESQKGSHFSADDFFASQPPPAHLEEHLEAVRDFVERNASSGRRVVLITSGGTTVPLEQNTVRFLDNFSAGTRGSASAEHFLRTGQYAVIFLHRHHSLQPFLRQYGHSTNSFLDLLEVVDDDADAAHDTLLLPAVGLSASLAMSQNPLVEATPTQKTEERCRTTLQIPSPHLGPMLTLVRSYKVVKDLGILHSIPFTTIDEYLFFLRGISRVMGTAKDAEGKALRRRGMYYLAAAVSDFYIPMQRMSKHKIQSGKGSLIIQMDQVPKVLKAMVDEWSNDGYIVSLKLETDPTLLVPKSRTALERYGHHLVIGNTLADRKREVVFVEKDAETWVRNGEFEYGAISGGGGEGREIEEIIVRRLVSMHGEWIGQEK